MAKDLLIERPGQLVAMYSCDETRGVLKETLDAGMVAFLEKTMEPSALLTEIRRLCAKYEKTSKPIVAGTEPDQMEQQIRAAGMVGRSPYFSRTTHSTRAMPSFRFRKSCFSKWVRRSPRRTGAACPCI